jgi:VCBS repeat-containing protein
MNRPRPQHGILPTSLAIAFLVGLLTPGLALAVAPVAEDDGYVIAEDVQLTVAAPGVLATDTDGDADALTANLVNDVNDGSLTLSADGSFNYTPGANFNGTDSFTYVANDGTDDSNTATVTITVTSVNDPPAAANDAYSANEDATLTVNAANGVLDNDSDVESGTLTAVLVSTVGHGSLSLTASGSFTYTPTSNYSGPDSFSYRANDGTANSNVATVSLTVNGSNDPPVAIADSYATGEDVPLAVAAPGVLGNDSDPDPGTTLTTELVSGPTSGSLDLHANGGFTFTPAASTSGTASFTYHATDGVVDSNNVTVTLAISSINDPPTTVPDAYSTNEDGQLNRNQASVGVLANDSDPEGNSFTASMVAQPTHGVMVAFGTNGTFRYAPTANYSGTDTFSYRATDSLGAASAPTLVAITINPVNDAPVAAGDVGSTAEDVPLVVAAPGVLANDTDVDSASLTVSLVTGPTHGTVSLAASGGFTYSPAPDYSGPDSFTYRANDGSLDSNNATVSLTVTPVGDAPVAVADSRSTNEDTILNASSVLANDSDPDGGTLTAVLDTLPATGSLVLNGNGTFTYVPAANANGTATFDYHASDGSNASGSAKVTITIVAVNDAPIAASDSRTTVEDALLSVAAPGLKSNVSDIDTSSSSLITSLWTQASHGTAAINANGSWTYQPAANYSGPDSFSYRVSDGVLFSAPATVNLTVTAVNDAPVASGDGYAPTEDAALTVLAAGGVLADDTDIDSASLTAVLVSGPSHGTLGLQSTGAFTYTPSPDYNGADSFTYRASDGLLQSSTATVSLTIGGVNDPPTFTLGADPAVAEDSGASSYPGFLSALSPGPANEVGQTASILSVVAANTALFAAQPVIGQNGTLTFTPAANRNGSSEVTVTVKDSGGTANGGDDTSIEIFLITVVPENDTVFANSDSWMLDDQPPAWVEAGVTTPLDVLENDVTLDQGETLTIASVTMPGHGTVTIAPDKLTVTYRSVTGYVGTDTFKYRMTDGVFPSNEATVFLSVWDTLPPTLSAPTFRFVTGAQLTSKVKVRLGWTASDAGRGVKSYDVQQSTNGGASWTTVYGATTSTGATRSLTINAGYTYRFRARDKGNRLSAWSPTTSFVPTRYQETTSLATYSSGWKTASIGSASGDKTKFAKVRGALSTFTFTGRAVSLVAPRSSSRGKAEIRVDGVLLGTVNLYRASIDARRHVWSRAWSSVGSHVVSVRVLGTVGHPRFDIDAWTVLK